MPVPALTTPVLADLPAILGPGEGGRPSKPNDNVSLPEGYSFDRVTKLELGERRFTEEGPERGTSLLQMGFVEGDESHYPGLNWERWAPFVRTALPASNRPTHQLMVEVGCDAMPLLSLQKGLERSTAPQEWQEERNG